MACCSVIGAWPGGTALGNICCTALSDSGSAVTPGGRFSPEGPGAEVAGTVPACAPEPTLVSFTLPHDTANGATRRSNESREQNLTIDDPVNLFISAHNTFHYLDVTDWDALPQPVWLSLYSDACQDSPLKHGGPNEEQERSL